MSTTGSRGSGDTQVLVVGAGPAGLSLAVGLARRGIAVHIIDTLAQPTDESRAIVVHSRTLNHFEALGVLDAIMERAIVSTGMEVHSDGRTIAAVDFDHIQAVYPYSVSLVQSETEAVLAARLAQLRVPAPMPSRQRTASPGSATSCGKQCRASQSAHTVVQVRPLEAAP